MKITFFTLIYKIKSKFNFQKYYDWGINLIKTLKNHELIIFTDKNTYKEIKKLVKGKQNITIIYKDLDEFELNKYKEIFKKNTSKRYFPNHNISYELVLIWINRHLFFNEISKLKDSDFYCHLDWGYFRQNPISNFCSEKVLSKLNKNKIYFALIRNDIVYLKKIINLIEDFNKEKIEKTLEDNLWSLGGGISIVPKNKIRKWERMYRTIFDKFLKKGIDFKDDQTIVRSTIFNESNFHNFELITQLASKGFTNMHINSIRENKFNLGNVISYLQLICPKKKYSKYISLKEKSYQLQNIEKIVDKKTYEDDWYPFINFLSGNYKDIIKNNFSLFFKDWYIMKNGICDEIIFENKNLIIYNCNDRVIINLIGNLDITNNFILENLCKFIECRKLYVVDKNCDIELLNKLSSIFNFKLYLL